MKVFKIAQSMGAAEQYAKAFKEPMEVIRKVSNTAFFFKRTTPLSISQGVSRMEGCEVQVSMTSRLTKVVITNKVGGYFYYWNHWDTAKYF